MIWGILLVVIVQAWYLGRLIARVDRLQKIMMEPIIQAYLKDRVQTKDLIK